MADESPGVGWEVLLIDEAGEKIITARGSESASDERRECHLRIGEGQILGVAERVEEQLGKGDCCLGVVNYDNALDNRLIVTTEKLERPERCEHLAIDTRGGRVWEGCSMVSCQRDLHGDREKR